MNKLNDIDNSITSRQLNELLRIILYGDLSLKIMSTDFDCNYPIHDK